MELKAVNVDHWAKYFFPVFIICGLLACSQTREDRSVKDAYVRVKDGKFVLNDSNYYYFGTNYWYGPSLGLMEDSVRGIGRLRAELDFLKNHGITNLRICAAVEGEGTIQGVPRIVPVFQSKPGVFNVSALKGLDILLDEMSKREMKAVLFFSNNWEWSGGFLQYLYWNKKMDSIDFYQRMPWDKLRDEVSQFYSCEPCIGQYHAQIKKVLGHFNSINNRKYTEDPTIFAWQLANEPRPMRPSAIEAYKVWIKNTAKLIKSIDSNHLVTIGVEGYIGTENKEVFKEIHEDGNIDYATIHIWPKNWAWYKDINDNGEQKNVLTLTKDYIKTHADIMKSIGKPLVIEEFGYPRDNNRFYPGTTTALRDTFYRLILNEWRQSVSEKGILAGCNFWAFGGTARPIRGQKFWKPGDDFMGDPPMEEQGLYSVFDTDTSTWRVIGEFVK
ncbi:MAG: cellulase family glycosylhydrolase [Saprospiraceae bacterium]|nr:cellulase family glycosylhydrolase [Saprospiraceae bacterium]